MKESVSLLGLPLWVGLLYLLLGFASVKAEWHGELSFRSDYVYRGYSKSQGDPVVQGLIDYQRFVAVLDRIGCKFTDK